MSAGLPYLRRSARRLTPLLLPALLLRALIPIGFMPLISSGGLTIGFCPGEGALPAALAAANVQLLRAHTAHHDHLVGGGAHGPGEPGRSAHEAPCLFAASAKPAFAPAILAVAVSAPDVAAHSAPVTDTVFLPTIHRAQSSRGPPLSA
jgi:hypothetical protein